MYLDYVQSSDLRLGSQYLNHFAELCKQHAVVDNWQAGTTYPDSAGHSSVTASLWKNRSGNRPEQGNGELMRAYHANKRREAARKASIWRRREHRKAQEQKRAMCAVALILGLLLPLGLGIAMPNGNAEHAYATQPQSDRQCEALCGWPVLDPRIEREFEKPAKRWLSGHRGIDLTAQAGTVIVAPQAGIIRFAGKVAEKDVVSMRHSNGVISTFEPATTTLTVGAAVTQGQFIGTVGGASDHCTGQCLHWGLKRGEDDYLDPQRHAGNQKNVLKPL